MSHSASSQESYHDLPFDFRIRDDDLDQSALVDQSVAASAAVGDAVESDADSYDDGFNWGHNDDSIFFRAENSNMASTKSGEQCDAIDGNDFCSSSMDEPADQDLLDMHALNALEAPTQASVTLPEVQQISHVQSKQEHSQASMASSEQTQTSDQATFIAHKGTLKQIIHPQNTESPSQNDPSIWPIYSITVSAEQPIHITQSTTSADNPSHYQILYSRSQYEQCIKLFTLLDTECKSSLGPQCIRQFVLRYCPVIRKRDDALLALNTDQQHQHHVTEQSTIPSATLDEIWNTILYSDPSYHQKHINARLGIESFLLFIRLLSLVSHLESRRRFASRHLQQMMRHKHSSSSSRNNNTNNTEVVVVIDNPPAGPPLPVSIEMLMEVELELGTENTKARWMKDWPYGSLPMIELDLDHGVNKLLDCRSERKMRVVKMEPFSITSNDGDFIVRYSHNGVEETVVRRSYADFCWLNETLVKQKKPGRGKLCGRILPPFPPRHESSSSGGGVRYTAPRPKDVSERAVAAAKSGVGIITSVAKSLWGNYIAPSAAVKSPSVSPEAKAHYSWNGYTTRDQDAPALLAKRMDRYLNYMLENSTLSTSFSLNALLTASQSGLECSKQILHDYAKQKKRSRSTRQFTTRGSTSSAYAILSTLLSKTPPSSFNLSDGDDSPWLRTAARTAMSLQFHGILETTGHESTSAKIQHASLPKFGVSASSWDEEESENAKGLDKSKPAHPVTTDGDFEEGVIRIESELAGEDDIEGYDLLPSPGPSEEHHVLNATNNLHSASEQGYPSPARVRFVYGASNPSNDSPEMLYENTTKAVTLGSVKVDSDIDKLKRIIKSVDHILKRLHKSSMIIESAQTTRNALQLDLLKDIDSFGDCRGGVINQRSLVDGVAALGRSNATIDRSNGNMTDDFGWQSALASSAVGATREVKEAVLASRTASRAKTAAFTAAAKSKKAYESLDSSSSRDEINAAQSEASTTQSHAIHATVVEYEANIAKKRAAVSLAQDVKSWNAYRKRELRQTFIEYAKSQREACGRAALAWECLRDGLIDSSGPLFAPGELDLPELARIPCADNVLISSSAECSFPEESNELSAGESVDHSSLRADNESRLVDVYNEQMNKQENDQFVDVTELTASAFELDDSEDNVYLLQPPNLSNLDEDHYALHQDIISAAESSSQDEDEAIDTCAFQHDDLGIESVLDQKGEDANNYTSDPIGENMTMSMQSLIDGLMAWGGEEEPVNDIGYQSEGFGSGMKRSSLLE